MSRFDSIERLAQKITKSMSPLEMGLLVYPTARPIPLTEVPEEIIKDHLGRYTEADLESGQFFVVIAEKYTFFMSKETKSRKMSEEERTERNG